MRRVLLVLALLVVVVMTALPTVAQEARPSIAEWLANDADGRFTTLLAAVEAAGLSDTLAGLEDVTFLAPTNDGFAASLEALGVTADDVLASPELLTRILTYHIIPGRYQFTRLTSGPALATVEGGEVQFDLTDGVFTVNGVNISDVDNFASNGIVHAIDGVLVPEGALEAPAAPAEQPAEEPAAVAGVPDARPTIVEWLTNDADGRFTTLLAAVQAAGLGDAFAALDDVTLLAPTNDAFAASLESMGLTPADVMGNMDLLTAVLNYHLIPGRYQFTRLTSGPALATVEGDEVQFDLTDGVFTVNGVNISDVDNFAANGIVHVIDGVLVPAALVPAQEPAAEPTEEPAAVVVPSRPTIGELLANDADARFTTLLSLVDGAGLGPAIETLDGVTFLAPTNDGIAATLEFLGVSQEDLAANPALVGQILRYHILTDAYMFRNLTSGPALGTQAGSTVQFDLTDGVFTVNNVGISDVDNMAANGVVHVIDGLLLPRSAASTFPTYLRVVHASPDVRNVDVYVNGTPQKGLTNVGPGHAGEWATLVAGTYNVAVAPTGTRLGAAVVAPESLTLPPGQYTTLVVVGSQANGTLAGQVVVEDVGAGAGQASVTLFHAIEGGPAVNVLANGALLVGDLAYPGSAGDNDGAFTLVVPAGTYDVVVNAGGQPLLDAGEVTFVGGTHYFVMATGTLDDPQIKIIESAAE